MAVGLYSTGARFTGILSAAVHLPLAALVALWCADLGRPPIGPSQAPGATVVGGVYRSTLGDYLSTLCSEVGLEPWRSGMCSDMVLGGKPLGLCGRLSGVGLACGPYLLTAPFAPHWMLGSLLSVL